MRLSCDEPAEQRASELAWLASIFCSAVGCFSLVARLQERQNGYVHVGVEGRLRWHRGLLRF
jgi:hypothetical protein